MRFPRLGWSAAVTAVICATGMVWAVPAAAVAAGPQAELSIEPAPSPLSVTFVASAFDFKPVTYVFEFGDGHTVKTTSPTVVHTYAKPGHFVPRVIETGTAAVDTTITAVGTLNVDSCAAGKSCTETLHNAGTVMELGVSGPTVPSMAASVNLFVGPSQITNCEKAPETNGGGDRPGVHREPNAHRGIPRNEPERRGYHLLRVDRAVQEHRGDVGQ